MGGIQKLLLRITPIVMLICFICFGITYTFQSNPAPNEAPITYLSSETITIDDRNTIETTDDITLENFTFDFASYRQNIDINILKRATQNTIDIETYRTTLSSFNAIWENGYNIGDISKTILNAVILTIDSLLTVINIVITPMRIIAGIILTGISIVGININRETPIITALNTILDFTAIPLIQPVSDNQTPTLYNSHWIINQPAPQGYSWQLEFDFESTPDMQTAYNFDEIIITNTTIQYRYRDNHQLITVYRNNSWINSNWANVWITDNNLTSGEEYNIRNMLEIIATEQ